MAAGSNVSGEDSIIARYFKPLATDPGAFGLTDDAAVLKADGFDIVVNTDAIVEGVHFLPDDPPETIARKALRVNLSDLAAKGAKPAGFVLTLALREQNADWLSAFASGLGQDALLFSCPLLGGDTVSTPGPIMISITAFGRVPDGRMVRRNGARPGDIVMVTGTIGDAALGLDVLKGGPVRGALAHDMAAAAGLIARYRIPQPRSGLARSLRDHARAAMDVSDGLAGDLAKLLAVSGVAATLSTAAIPLSSVAGQMIERGVVQMETLLSGGDDYEILCTIPPSHLVAFMDEALRADVPVSAIGTVQAGTGLRFVDAQGGELILSRLSYSHF